MTCASETDDIEMSNRTITTEATACRSRQPQKATIEAMIVGNSSDPASARALVRDRTETIRGSITTISSEQLQTVEIRVDEVDDLFGPETDADYRAEETLAVRCHPEQLGALVTEITDAGGTVQRVEFGLQPATRQQLQDDALEPALERAREQAERIAATEGLRLSRVHSVSTLPAKSSNNNADFADELLVDAGRKQLTPTPIEVAERVEVIYQIVDG